jgi:ABC-type dipeptide/oligopeptide/nickel transport system permease component
VIVGGILLVATMFVLVNLLVDLLYAVIDPRVRREA